jgi:hypothetical protein
MVTKSRRIRWVGHVALTGTIKFELDNLGKDHLEGLAINGRTILKWILKKQSVNIRTGSSSLTTGPVAGSCEHGNESLGFIKDSISLTSE